MDALRGSAAGLVFLPHHRLRHLERKLRHCPVPAALCLGLSVHWMHVSWPNVFCSSPLRCQRPRNAPRYFRRARLLMFVFPGSPWKLEARPKFGINAARLSLILLNSPNSFSLFGMEQENAKPNHTTLSLDSATSRGPRCTCPAKAWTVNARREGQSGPIR